MEIIAHVRTDFPTKFGVPRQSGLVREARGRVVFEPPYRNPDALRGIEDFSHLWILWEFSKARRQGWSATVRPPRLGGNTRLGVFATRSPFRPNAIGLSCVRLEGVDWDGQDGPALIVSGVDMLDGTPVYDIKPYLPYVDSHPEARGGFTEEARAHVLKVEFPEELLHKMPAHAREAIIEILSQDPRPAYQDDPGRLYGVPYAGMDVRFTVSGDTLTVREVVEYQG